MSQKYVDNVYDSTFVVQTTMANIEKNFAALKSAFSGPTAPSDPIAGMWWLDTTTHILKQRNEANNAWLNIWDFANNKPIIANLSNEITGAMIAAAVKNPVAGTAGLRTLSTTGTTACAGNDARLSNTRTPTNNSVSQAKMLNRAIGKAELKTSTQSQSFDMDAKTGHTFIFTGGQYCFRSTWKGETTDIRADNAFIITTSYATSIHLYNSNETTKKYGYALHRYITASGEINWLFILRDKITKRIIGRSIAPDHPCFGNGGKPLLVSHPFGDYDEIKYEIIVINPINEEIEQMELETIVDDETKPDKDLIEVITENYEIDEISNPSWPTIPVTVGLPKHIIDKKTGKKTLADYRFMKQGDIIQPIKKVISKPPYIKVKKLKRK